jgi:hypothetical protein
MGRQIDDPKKLLIALSIIFAIVGLIGVIDGSRLWRDWDRMKLWTPTPCTIITDREKQIKTPRYIVEYTYIAGDRKYRSTRFGVRSLNSFSWVCRNIDFPTEQRNSLTRWPTGSIATCYVNPINSAQSVMSIESPISFWLYGLAWILTILSPVCLISYFVLKRNAQRSAFEFEQKLEQEQKRTESLERLGFDRPEPAISQPGSNKKLSEWLTIIAMGTIAGIVFIAAMSMVIIPAAKIYWVYGYPELQPVPCETISIDTVWASGNRSMSKGVQITFKYEVNGIPYQSSRYAGTSEYLNIKNTKKIESLFPGTTTKCYVNPGYPDKAVLVDDAELNKFFMPIFVAGFVVVWMGLFLSGVIKQFRDKNL